MKYNVIVVLAILATCLPSIAHEKDVGIQLLLQASTPLHRSAYNGHTKAIDHYLSMPFSSINTQDKYGLTPLHYAVLSGKKETVTYLIKTYKDIKVNKHDNSNTSPLIDAVINGFQDIVEILINWGADTTVRDYKNRNLYDLAKLYNHLTLMEWFDESSKIKHHKKAFCTIF